MSEYTVDSGFKRGLNPYLTYITIIYVIAVLFKNMLNN